MPATALRAPVFASIVFAIAVVVPLPNALAAAPDAKAAMEEVQNLVQEADLLRSRGELAAAVSSYRNALEGVPNSVEYGAFRASVAERFASTSVAQATALAQNGQYEAADKVVDAVLVPGYAPTYAPALELKEELQDADRYNFAETPEHRASVAEVSRLLRQAEGFEDLGLFAEALDTYTAVLQIDRYNTAARRGMEKMNRKISKHHQSSRDHFRADAFRKVDELWETAIPEFDPGEGNAFEIGGNGAGASVTEKLNRTIIPRVVFTDATVSEVVDFLTAQSRQLDPTDSAQKGVNIVINADPSYAERRISLGLSSTPLAEVIRYVADLSGMVYRADAFAVKLVPAGSAVGTLRTQIFKVPPTFISATDDTSSAASDDPFADAVAASSSGITLRRRNAKDFLAQSGITFPEGANAGFNAASSTLTITNTDANIDAVRLLVEEAVASAANQVVVTVKLLETTQEDLQELGYDWLLGQFNVPGSDRVFAGGGTSPLSGTPLGEATFVPPGSDVPVGQFPVTAGNRSGNQIAELSDGIDGVLQQNPSGTGELRSPGVFSVGGVFTDPQVQVLIRALNQKTAVDVGMSPEIVTRSGQRASVSITREFPYPTEFDPPEIPQTFGSGSATLITAFGSQSLGGDTPVVATPTTPTTFDVRELGASLEVEPVIGPDGKTVDLNLSPELDEFEGFINYGSPITDGQVVVTENTILAPVFRTIRETLRVAVWDGQTVAIGGLLEKELIDTNDSVPGLGDAPLLGRFFKSKLNRTKTRAIVFLVSVKIIDPGGNSVVSAGQR